MDSGLWLTIWGASVPASGVNSLLFVETYGTSYLASISTFAPLFLLINHPSAVENPSSVPRTDAFVDELAAEENDLLEGRAGDLHEVAVVRIFAVEQDETRLGRLAGDTEQPHPKTLRGERAEAELLIAGVIVPEKLRVWQSGQASPTFPRVEQWKPGNTRDRPR